MKNLKIGIICYPTFGGSGVIAAELGMTLASWGHEVHLFSYAFPSRVDYGHPKMCFHEIEGFSYPLFKYPPYDLALASRLIEVAQETGLDIVHAHYAIPHSLSAFLARESTEKKFKTLTTLHGTDITLVGAERSYFPMTRFGIEMSDGVSAVSESLKKDTLEIFKVDKEIDVIPNFVDTSLFSPPEAAPKGEKVIAHVSNFRPVKRIQEIVAAFSTISKALPSRLVLVGEGPESGPVRELVHQLGLSKKVEFLGNQTSVQDILKKSHLYMLASQTESFGLSALEAMACGVPVVCPSAGGLPEVIVDEQCGLLVPGGKDEDLAAAAIRILEDEKTWSSMSRAARARAVDHFGIEKIVSLYQKLYCKVLGTSCE